MYKNVQGVRSKMNIFVSSVPILTKKNGIRIGIALNKDSGKIIA